MPLNISGTWPPRKSCIAGGEPRYGMCFSETFAALASCMPRTCDIVPALYDA